MIRDTLDAARGVAADNPASHGAPSYSAVQRARESLTQQFHVALTDLVLGGWRLGTDKPIDDREPSQRDCVLDATDQPPPIVPHRAKHLPPPFG